MILELETYAAPRTYVDLLCEGCEAKLAVGYWPGPTWASDYEALETDQAVRRWRAAHADCQPQEVVR